MGNHDLGNGNGEKGMGNRDMGNGNDVKDMGNLNDANDSPCYLPSVVGTNRNPHPLVGAHHRIREVPLYGWLSDSDRIFESLINSSIINEPCTMQYYSIETSVVVVS